MKKYVFLMGILFCSFLLVGCGRRSDADVLRDMEKALERSNGYYIEGEMELINNQDIYRYEVRVSYRNDMFKVNLINKENNHEQIILRNSEGVYVITPSLNKSFKFQSEWPHNNSQVYLLQSIINDLKNDANRTFEEKDGMYVFNSTVHYPNNRNLRSQVVYVDKDLKIQEVHVLDERGTPAIKMKFNKIDMNATFSNNHFALNELRESIAEAERAAPVMRIESATHPRYMPLNTHLNSQDNVGKDGGDRVISTFAGETPFMIVEETVSIPSDFMVVPVSGDPVLIGGAIAAVTDTSVNFISSGIEYYIVSDVMGVQGLLQVARSLAVSSLQK